MEMLRQTLPECAIYRLFDGYPMRKAINFIAKLKAWRVKNKYSECKANLS
jgi:hypothetical protein